jgi:hypothetical protein
VDNQETTPASTRISSSRPALTADRLREVLDYDPQTGWFTHKPRPEEFGGSISGLRQSAKAKTWNTRYAGRRAGYLHKPSGYWIITVDDVHYKAHRAAHLFMNGEWPPETVDHRSGARADNRWSRLRPASTGQQNANLGRRRDNTSGFKGVCWEPGEGKWRAYINSGGARIELGRFKDQAGAIAARAVAEKKFHGEFARGAVQ